MPINLVETIICYKHIGNMSIQNLIHKMSSFFREFNAKENQEVMIGLMDIGLEMVLININQMWNLMSHLNIDPHEFIRRLLDVKRWWLEELQEQCQKGLVLSFTQPKKQTSRVLNRETNIEYNWSGTLQIKQVQHLEVSGPQAQLIHGIARYRDQFVSKAKETKQPQSKRLTKFCNQVSSRLKDILDYDKKLNLELKKMSQSQPRKSAKEEVFHSSRWPQLDAEQTSQSGHTVSQRSQRSHKSVGRIYKH